MKVLVYGFYGGKNNLGDQFFLEAYKSLFPDYHFTFTDEFTEGMVQDSDAIFFGGGSFLDGEPKIPKGMIEGLKKKKIFYLGVGAETNIHPWHKYLIQCAKLVAVRNTESLNRVASLNNKVILCPDLVYSLQSSVRIKKRKPKTILFLPNSHTASKWDSQAWKHISWEFFKSETAQVFENLLRAGWTIDVLPMCENLQHKDHYAAGEIINKMHESTIKFLPFKNYLFNEFSELMTEYDLVISQRYHGLIVADMTETPSINIHHHDKLRYFSAPLNINLDYYRASKESFLGSIDKVMRLNPNLGINTNAFTELKTRVRTAIEKE